MTERWKGLAELVRDAVHHGTLGVEEVHQRVAATPLELIALVPPLAAPARWLAGCQRELIATTYTTIRAANAAAGALVGVGLDLAARAREPGTTPNVVAGEPPGR